MDDDKFRSASLLQYIVTTLGIGPENLTQAFDVEGAMDSMSRIHFDVLILDVVLPKGNGDLKADSKNGLNLLTKITRTAGLKKPTKIIGISAHLEDLGRFKSSFERHCLIVIEANRRSIGWRRKISDYIGYDDFARSQREIDADLLNVITVHGIRTFGHWQMRLENLVHEKFMNIPFHSYKYGYESFLALFFKSRHSAEINRLSERLKLIFDGAKNSKFVLFSHSFGTYLALEAIRMLLEQGTHVPIRTIVFSGSVLSSATNLSFMRKNGINIVNDCAESDYALWVSEAFIPHLGMAGKIGFFGFENANLINRFFRGGHSSYFDGDEFMEEYWLPILRSAKIPEKIDIRKSTAVENDIFEKNVLVFGRIKCGIVQFMRKLKGSIV